MHKTEKAIVELIDIAEEISRCGSINIRGVEGLLIGKERKDKLQKAVLNLRPKYKLLGGKKVYPKHTPILKKRKAV